MVDIAIIRTSEGVRGERDEPLAISVPGLSDIETNSTYDQSNLTEWGSVRRSF